MRVDSSIARVFAAAALFAMTAAAFPEANAPGTSPPSFANPRDYFDGGPDPDLVVVTSTDVHGEIEPCG